MSPAGARFRTATLVAAISLTAPAFAQSDRYDALGTIQS
jgi:hypothetical protein